MSDENCSLNTHTFLASLAGSVPRWDRPGPNGDFSLIPTCKAQAEGPFLLPFSSIAKLLVLPVSGAECHGSVGNPCPSDSKTGKTA